MSHVSPSQLATFKGCPRKWAYRYIDGIKTPPKPTQEFGLAGHKRNEDWLRSGKHVGDDDVGKVCQQGIRPGFMPTPAPDLQIECKLDVPILGGATNMLGYIDCVLPPRNTGPTTTLPVVHDWKFTKDLRWAMTPEELAQNEQVAVYCHWVQQQFKAPKVVARWVYFCGRTNAKSADGRPRTPRGVKKVELTFTAAECEANWQRELETAKQILEVRNTYEKADQVPGNELHCDAYGGCDYRERCPLGGEVSLGGLFNQWDRTHDYKETDKMSEAEVMAKLRAHTALMRGQKQNAAEAAAAETAAPTPEVAAPPVETNPTTTTKTPPAEPPADDTTPAAGIEVVAQLQAQSGEVAAEPAAEADATKNLLSTLQAQTGATTINPPEAAVVVAKTEAPPPTVTEAPTETTEQPPPTVTEAPTETTEQPPATVVEATKPAKEAKAKKPKATTPKAGAKAAKVPFVLCIDTVPSKLTNGALGEVIHLSEFVEPFATAIAKGHRCTEHPQGVDHWNLIEYANGPSILAHKVAYHLDNKGFSGVLVVDSYTAEGRALTDVLTRRADAIFRGVR